MRPVDAPSVSVVELTVVPETGVKVATIVAVAALSTNVTDGAAKETAGPEASIV